MGRMTRVGLIQAHHDVAGERPLAEHKKTATDKHVEMIFQAKKRGAEVVCLQELFYGPYFCAEQNPRWYDLAEPIPHGPTTQLMQSLAKETGMALIVPMYEEVITGLYYNTAAVIDADGRFLGKYRKVHLPQVQAGKSPHTGFWEKFYFRPGDLEYPVFRTQFANIGVYICYDRHFPEGARALGLNGAEIVFNPSATVAGLSEYLWKLEQPAHAAANGYFVGAINRIGWEMPWNLGEFYGQSYLVDPRGNFVGTASRSEDEVLVCDADLDMVRETRNTWQFFRDRRPETYTALT
ncbi:nitrilase-related carbon-nitrogen hydrolase [Sulfobacillus harzensis]|uniref:Acyltransferase n=1 Tax=Sulfobacillus harzensis TaxID=2729629 RepID=A0A7Y0L5A8_9FIRM|nr:nitrilase-related carbon-nitrogen hydrolase [Sulfobacillus harzensis]NMP23588.1 acyltransferase [Sulfobacillus harzensis]